MKIKREITTINLNGYEVMITDLRIKTTYSNVWAGKPSPHLNQALVKNGFNYPSEWGPSQKVLLLRPKPEVINTVLPAYMLTALLDCHKAVDPVFDGSWLVVSWFTEQLFDQNIKDHLQEILQDIDWKFSSQDYPI